MIIAGSCTSGCLTTPRLSHLPYWPTRPSLCSAWATASTLCPHVVYFRNNLSRYEHFNAMGIFFDAAFAALGGQRVGSALTLDSCFGLGDDDGTLEDDFSAWREVRCALPSVCFCNILYRPCGPTSWLS